MRAEVRAERPAAEGAREGVEQRAAGFARALREALARRAPNEADLEGRTATATATPTPTATATSTPTSESGGGASRSAEVAARAVAAVAAAREAGQAALVVSAGDGVRYEVSGCAAGVALLALAPPLLERVAGAARHAVGGACDRRGVLRRRATVRVEGRGSGGGGKR